MSEDRVLRLKRRFRAPRAQVFRAFTEVGLLQQWWGRARVTLPKAEIDLRPGGAYRFEMRTPAGDLMRLGGVFREIRPDERLVYTFTWAQGEWAGIETLVTLEFRDAGADTEIELTHVLPGIAAREAHRVGWTEAFDRLDAML